MYVYINRCIYNKMSTNQNIGNLILILQRTIFLLLILITEKYCRHFEIISLHLETEVTLKNPYTHTKQNV